MGKIEQLLRAHIRVGPHGLEGFDVAADRLSNMAARKPTEIEVEIAAGAIALEGFPKGRESARDYRLRLARAALSAI